MGGIRTNSCYYLNRIHDYLVSRDVPGSLCGDLLNKNQLHIADETRYSIDLTDDIFKKSSLLLGDNLVGLKSGKYFQSLKFGLFHTLLGQAETLEHGIHLSIRYLALETQAARMTLIRGPHQSQLAVFPSTEGIGRHQIDNVISQTLMRLYRSDPDWISVQFAHAKSSKDEEAYAGALECPVKFGAPYHAINLKTEQLNYIMGFYDESMMQALEGVANKRLKGLLEETSIVDEVQFHTRQLLLSGNSDLSGIARRMDMGERNLQKLLQSEDSSFRKIMNSVRKELAIELVHNPEFTTEDIAQTLGYEDMSSFYRFFKKVTGQNIKDYRSEVDYS